MRTAPLLALTLLAACSGKSDGGNNESVDVDAAANRAQRDIANYAAGTPTPAPDLIPVPPPLPVPLSSPVPTPSPTEGPTQGPTKLAAVTPVGTMQAAASQRTPAAAVQVVRDYATALSQRRYRDAWGLWRGGGKASGVTADAFAASFEKYASVSGKVGEPRDQDVGAGQIRIIVPLTLRGELKRGGPFLMRGPVVLHRVNDGIETPDAVDHLWRIESSGLKPRPVEAMVSSPKIGQKPR